MSDASPELGQIGPDGPENPVPAAASPARPRGRRRRAIGRWTRHVLVLLASVVAAGLFLLFTVDIGRITIGGRSLKTMAEAEASKFLERPMRIGSISAHITPGKFVLRDVVIEGFTPQDRPFFSAKQITVDVPWWTLFNQRQLYIDIRLTGWRMVVEKDRAGKTHVPKLTGKKKSDKPFPLKIRGLAIYGTDGEFIYDDQATPWSVIGRNLKFDLVRSNNLNTYVGLAEFTKGTVQIQSYEPMQADFRTRFQIDGGLVNLHHIDLLTDGAESHIGGFVDFAKWPEQEYRIQSTVDFNRMRELFFAREDFRLSGSGRFNGVFKIFKETGEPGEPRGFDLSGLFKSDEAGLGIGNAEWRFPNLDGSLQWTPTSFTVHRADSDLLGGRMSLAYGLAPLGSPTPYTATLTADYNGVDLSRFTRQFGWTALEPQGRMHGHLALAWPKGKFAERLGTGSTVITSPSGQVLAAATLPASAEPIPAETNFQKYRPLGEFPIAASTSYRFAGSALDFDPSWVATPTTYVKFRGRATGGPADLAFHVTSHDWQNSDRLFAAIMSNFSRPMGGIDVGGRGTFDGTFTGPFSAPRIAGRFAADNMRAWGQTWGTASGDIVVLNSYLTVTNGRVEHASGGRVLTTGKYSLGYPRSDGGEEINAHIRAENMSLKPLMEAFDLADWPVTGTLAVADLGLRGAYEKPTGTGEMHIQNGTAWDEPFSDARGDLSFEGDGSLRVSRIEMRKGPGVIKGGAWVSWAANAYSFEAHANRADGGGLPVEELANFKIERARLTGILSFRASGAGSFDAPTWRIDEGQIPDLYVGDEAIGAVAFRMSLANRVLTIEEIVAEHDRLHLGCNGTIEMNDASDARLRCGFTNASLDPYLKFVAREMPYTRAIVTGSVDIVGPLRDQSRLDVVARIDDRKALLTLFDYKLENDGPLHLSFRQNTVRLGRVTDTGIVEPLKFVGADQTNLALSGTANLTTRSFDLRASGGASLAILQGFYPSLSAGGSTSLKATLTGGFDSPVLTGGADISGGSLRHRDLPHGLRDINGPITMEAGRISVDGLRGVMGEGRVTFDGGIVLDGYRPEEFNVHANGQSMHLRFPEGLRSTVNADLYLRGPIKTPMLSGDVTVLQATYSLRYEPRAGYFSLLSNAVGDTGPKLPGLVLDTPSAFPLGLAIRVHSDVIPFVDNKNAGALISAAADVDIRGTIDHPIVTGDVKIDRGEWVFAGNRYRLLSGSINFNDPLTFDPFFELTAETPIRTGGQTYNVLIRLTGTLDRLQPTFTSEPWLPEFQIVSLLLGETPDVRSAELRALRAPQELQAQALQAFGVAIITSPISATVGSAVQRATGIDFQMVPFLGNESQQLNPGARFILGRRISERVYLTYSRTLSGTQSEIILIEFDQNDQVSWVLSRNEDRSFALDFRLRYVFR